MGQATKITQRRQHRFTVQSGRVAQGQGGQCVGQVVQSRQPQVTDFHQRIEAVGQPGFAADVQEAEAVQFRLAEAPADHLDPGSHQGNRQGVVPVHYHLVTAAKNAVLGGMIGGHAAVPVQVIGADVEHGGHGQAELAGAFELEAGELQHVEFTTVRQQVQRGCTEIAADTDVEPRCAGHPAQQLGHG